MINLEAVTHLLNENHLLIQTSLNERDFTFHKLSYNSKEADETTLFFAKGSHFKREYLSNLTAPVYVSEIDYEVALPLVQVKNIKRAMALIAAAFYNHPEKKLKTLAITGTKGKTTVAYLAKGILDLTTQGETALISTAETILDGKTPVKSLLTTPESLDLFRMMSKAVKNGMTHLVLEVSSQAYKLERVHGLTFDVGVFLNIFPDHIGPGEHSDFDDYFNCKRKLLDNSRLALVNSESAYFEQLENQVAKKPHLFFGLNSPNHLVKSDGFSFTATGLVSGDFDLKLLGAFNHDNALAAALATQAMGASLKDIKMGLQTTSVPGRMEVFSHPKGGKIYIDYAHNGESLKLLVDVVKSHHHGQLILVLGATGNKGENRRQQFAQVIENHPELEVILTQDDSNYENPETIAKEIAAGVTRPLKIIANRSQAIKEAEKLMQGPDDALILAGKGADQFQLINGVRQPYIGDFAVLSDILATKKKYNLL